MHAGIARSGRTLLAVIAAAAMVLAMMFVLTGPPALATNHQIRICHALGNGGYTAPIPTKQQIFDPDGHGSFVAGVHPDDIVPPFEAGSQGANSWDAYPGKNWDAAGQAIWENDCQDPDATTTTTVPVTTTTLPATTTTVPATTTVPGETTTTTIPDQVLASIVVTVDGVCVETDGDGEGVISVTVSVDDGATVVIRNSADDVVGTFTADGSVTVPEGATYTWEATPSEGFEFPTGAASSGSVVIETCSEEDVLPFTGLDAGLLAALATGLVAAGGAMLLGTRRREDA